MSKFVINLTRSNLIFKNGYINIPVGNYVEVSDADADSADFIMARTRQPAWIQISDTAPTSITVPAAITVTTTDPFKGLTSDELKQNLADKAEAEAKEAAETAPAPEAPVEVSFAKAGRGKGKGKAADVEAPAETEEKAAE
jgi:hypothetical protein